VNERKPFNPRDNKVIIGAVISFIVLLLFVILNYYPPDGKVFSIDGFYVGNKEGDINPKELYNEMYGGVAAGLSCNTEIKKSTNYSLINNIAWIAEGVVPESSEELKALATDDTCTVIRPYTTSYNMIVAPAEITFVNSNTTRTKEGSIFIVAKLHGDYEIQWDNITSWWCHIGKDNPDKHTLVCGANGICPTCREGYVLGEANNETLVSLYKVDGLGNRTPASFIDFYSLN